MADCCKLRGFEDGCYMCLPYWFPKPESGDLWGRHCMFCGNDWAELGSCKECADTYDKLKARGELPRRREAIEHTRSALGDTPTVA